MCRVLWCAVLLLLSGVTPCFAQEVTVRVINANNGHPVKHVSLLIRGMAPERRNLRLKTDANGEARFIPREDARPYIRVDVGSSPMRWDCGCFGEGYTDDVIQRGVVELHSGLHHHVSPRKVAWLTPTPGTILIALRPLSFFERLYMMSIGL